MFVNFASRLVSHSAGGLLFIRETFRTTVKNLRGTHGRLLSRLVSVHVSYCFYYLFFFHLFFNLVQNHHLTTNYHNTLPLRPSTLPIPLPLSHSLTFLPSTLPCLPTPDIFSVPYPFHRLIFPTSLHPHTSPSFHHQSTLLLPFGFPSSFSLSSFPFIASLFPSCPSSSSPSQLPPPRLLQHSLPLQFLASSSTSSPSRFPHYKSASTPPS